MPSNARAAALEDGAAGLSACAFAGGRTGSVVWTEHAGGTAESTSGR